MNNKDFMSKLSSELNSEEITLPENLSAENIESLINEKGGIVNPKRPVTHIGKRILKTVAAAAAVIVLLVGILAVADISMIRINEKKKNDILNTEIENMVENSDYSSIETIVLNYYKDVFSKTYDYYQTFGDKLEGAVNDMANGIVMEDAMESIAPGTTSSNNSAQFTDSHSSTNVQVNGVDEADIIKNDGRYIYYLTNNVIIISDCSDGENINVVSKIDLSRKENSVSYAYEFYVYNDKLIVLANKEKQIKEQYSEATNSACDCLAYALYCDTVIAVYDITDKAKPEQIYIQIIDGDYTSSRFINGKLITVSNYSIPYNYVSGDDFDEACNVIKSFSVPSYTVNGGESKKIEADRIKCFDNETPTQYIVTAIIDIDNLDAEPKLNAYLGGGYEVYCTEDEMFIAENLYSYWTMGEENIVTDSNGVKFQSATHIYSFDITDDGVVYTDDVVVGGTCINQFSMDKYGDYFRVATNGSKYGKDMATFVYVLDKDLKVVGYIENIAKGEQMKSARFMGNTLYLVTFYQTDPLFVIDLTDPTKPEVKGELKIPGFSSYLHPIGNGLVIGVGEGGTMNGTDGSAKVSLFDVSNPCEPKEIDNYTVANAYFDSNHKAFMAVDADTFALCLTGYNYGSGNYNETYKIMMFDVSENGIIVHGEYAGYSWVSGSAYYSGALRGAYINDDVFAVNSYGIKAYSMTTNELLGEAEF